MEKRADGHRKCDADRDELQELRSRLARDADSEPGPGTERRRDKDDTDEAPLFADHAAYEIVIRKRHEPALLVTVTVADAEQAAGADGDQRLPELIVDRRDVRSRVGERHESSEDVLQSLRLVPQHRRADDEQYEQKSDPDSAGEEDDRHE